jgi:hypothetical protein
VLAVAGCDMSMPSSSSSSSKGDVRTEKLKTNLTVDEMRQVAQPANNTPGLSVDVQNAQNMGLSAEMGDARGLTMRLFDTSVSGDDERFERLESAVQQLRDDFDAVSPAINRLVAIEREIQGLVDQLQVLVENDNTVSTEGVPPISSDMMDADTSGTVATAIPEPLPPVPLPPQDLSSPPETNTASAAPAPTTLPTPAPTPEPQVASANNFANTATLSLARAADHAGKTRLVFEMDKSVSYVAEINSQNYLILTFAGTKLNTDFVDKLKGSSLVAGAASVEESGNGYAVIVPLKRASKILSQGVLKPDAKTPTYRVYIDMGL